MRKLCPNYDREDALETVLEVPIPEEMFKSTTYTAGRHTGSSWHNIKSWMRSNPDNKSTSAALFGTGSHSTDIQLLLGVVGAPLIPLPIPNNNNPLIISSKDHPIESSMAKYIVQQYIAASGGDMALDSIDSMYAMGKVKMTATQFGNNTKSKQAASIRGGEMGGFVIWQKRPAELWCMELVVSGFKITAGSDGKVAWRQTPWHHSHASRGPPRPLRRFLQGLDPRSTANVFSNSVCIGEKSINEEDCFILKVEADSWTLKSRSTPNNVDIIRHTLLGYFSQRSGLLVHLHDSHLLRIKDIFWETTMDSFIHDYRTIDGVNIAHAGRTSVSLSRYTTDLAYAHHNSSAGTRMEEVWTIEEVDFNIKGLSIDCFLPPADLKKLDEGPVGNLSRLAPLRRSNIGGSRVATIDHSHADDDEDDIELEL